MPKPPAVNHTPDTGDTSAEGLYHYDVLHLRCLKEGNVLFNDAHFICDYMAEIT